MSCTRYSVMHRVLTLLLCLVLLLTTTFGSTFATLVTNTAPVINTFISGLPLTGDLVLSKTVTHPFGSGYILPDGLTFSFNVALGPAFAGRTVSTSHGMLTADADGTLTVSLQPGGTLRIRELPRGTDVTVTELSVPGFTPDGGAVQSVTVGRGDNLVAFTNVYVPAPADLSLLTVTGTKVLAGRDWQPGDSFAFLLEYKRPGAQEWQTAGTAAVEYAVQSVVDPDTGEPVLDALTGQPLTQPVPGFDTFDLTDTVRALSFDTAGVYAFRLTEQSGSIAGVGYDTTAAYFDVLVDDPDMDGSLQLCGVTGSAEAAVSRDETTGVYSVQLAVTNTYAPAGTASATLHIRKTVQSFSGVERSPAGFTFELYDAAGVLAATSAPTTAAGETSITLTFDAAAAGQTFAYTLKETNAGQTIAGMTFDSTVYNIVAEVVDCLDGTVSARLYPASDPAAGEEIPADGEDPSADSWDEPVNGEGVPAESENLSADSAAADSEPAEQGEPCGSGEEISDGAESQSESSASAAESVAPDSEPVDIGSADDGAVDGETVSGSAPDSESVSADSGAPVAAADETGADGAADSEPAGSEPFGTEPVTGTSGEGSDGTGDTIIYSFVNRYDPTDTSASFGGRKQLDGRAVNNGEFAFALYETGDSFAVAPEAVPLQTVVNTGDTFGFAAVGFDRVGTYRYTVREDPSAALGGITYDTAVYHVTVTVTDENGALTPTVRIADAAGNAAEMLFRNTYRPAKTEVVLSGTKTLRGAQLAAEMFRFLLYPADDAYRVQGDTLQTAYNATNGSFAFDGLEFTSAGDYYYVVAEDIYAEPLQDVTYDTTAYGVHVTVRDDGQGSLWADTTLCVIGGGPVEEIRFENVYTAPPVQPEDPDVPDEPDVPVGPAPSEKTDDTDTGDTSPVSAYIALMSVSMTLLLVLFTERRQRKYN